MAAITASMVAELRGKTDAPMMECKKALTEAEGDMVKAEELLRAVKQIVSHLERFIVLGIGRHVGLRPGFFLALGLQMAAQRRFALGVGP